MISVIRDSGVAQPLPHNPDLTNSSYPNSKKTPWEKEKLLITSNFSFSHSVFQKACFPGVSKSVVVWELINSLPDDQVLDWSNLKAFADDKLKVTEKLKFVLRRIENIIGKGENAGY